MSGTRERATGILKKVFLKRSEPFGFLKILTPLNLRGEEAVFYVKDMLLKPFEKKLLQQGMAMEFFVREKPEDFMQSFVPFRAEQIKPLDPAEYTASVIRSADPQPNGKGLLVCLDVCLMRVSITPASYNALKLETPLLPGDNCIVRVSWREMLDTALHGKVPTGEVLAVLRKESDSLRQRSASHEELSGESRSSLSPERNPGAQDEYSESTNELASEDEVGSAEDKDPRGRKSRSTETAPNRQRCRSVGDHPHDDALGYTSGMFGSHPNRGHGFPCMLFPLHMYHDESQFYPLMPSSQFHTQTDPAQRFAAMNQTQCNPAMNASQYQHAAMNAAQWLPPFFTAPRQEPRKMSLREYLDRAGKNFSRP